MDLCECPACGGSIPVESINAHLDQGCKSAKRPRTGPSTLQTLFLAKTQRAEGGHLESGSKTTQSSDVSKASLTCSSEVPCADHPNSPVTATTREPLAEKQRPRLFEALVGQEAFGSGSVLRRLVEEDRLPSLILWGPPGCGKTSIANIIRHRTQAIFKKLSAVVAGVKEVREVVEEAKRAWRLQQRRTILFLDECHRFNKSQQDVLLPHVESGELIFLGATTENPSFSLAAALLSRCKVVPLKQLEPGALEAILRKALEGPSTATVEEDALSAISVLADGDARVALNALELACSAVMGSANPVVNLGVVRQLAQRTHLLWDRKGDQHYNVISALHKSVRGSDVDASLYWLARQLESGEDPRYVTRRLIVMASEDIGLAEPRALEQAVAAHHAVQAIGMPEASIVLAHVVAFLAQAPKSVAVYKAYQRAVAAVRTETNLPPPLHICNAPTPLMRQLGYADGYIYPPDHGYPVKPQSYLPDALVGKAFFDPNDTQTTQQAPVPAPKFAEMPSALTSDRMR